MTSKKDKEVAEQMAGENYSYVDRTAPAPEEVTLPVDASTEATQDQLNPAFATQEVQEQASKDADAQAQADAEAADAEKADVAGKDTKK